MKYLGTSGKIERAIVKVTDGVGKIRLKGVDDQLDFSFHDKDGELELENVECPSIKPCFAGMLAIMIGAARRSGWNGRIVTLDADDNGNGKLVNYYKRFGFKPAISDQELSNRLKQRKDTAKKSVTIPMSLNLSEARLIPSARVVKAIRRAEVEKRKSLITEAI